MNVVIYSRVSSQSARQSTERQVVDLERFAAGRGYEVTAVFEEKISGRKANIERPILSRCLEYCTDPQNRVDMLLLTEISRLGRSTLEILKSLDTLHTHKICVYIQNLNLETLRPDKTVNPLSSLITTLLGNWPQSNARGSLTALIADGSCTSRKGQAGTEAGKSENGRTEERGIPGGDRLVKERLLDPERGEAHGKGRFNDTTSKKTSLVADYRNKYCIFATNTSKCT